MIAAAIVSFFVGMVLAQRFRIVVLIPLLSFAALGAAIAVFVAGVDAWHVTLVAIVSAVCLQFGYLAGAAFRTWGLLTTRHAKGSAAVEKTKSNPLPVH